MSYPSKRTAPVVGVMIPSTTRKSAAYTAYSSSGLESVVHRRGAGGGNHYRVFGAAVCVTRIARDRPGTGWWESTGVPAEGVGYLQGRRQGVWLEIGHEHAVPPNSVTLARV